jgi:hypothetical protein
LSPLIGFAIDKITPSPPTLHMVLSVGFLLQGFSVVLLKVPSFLSAGCFSFSHAIDAFSRP